MFIKNFLSRFSIRFQIIIGFIPVLVLLGFLTVAKYNNFQIFSNDLDDLSVITQEKEIFLRIEKDIVELQRNVLVYSYVGYRGVLKKIKFLQTELENKFEIVAPIARQDEEINSRFTRMIGHYTNYKNAFDEVVNKRSELKNLSGNQLAQLIDKNHKTLKIITKNLEAASNYKAAFIASKIERDLLQSDIKIRSFEKTPDTLLIKEIQNLVVQIKQNILILEGLNIGDINQKLIDDFLYQLNEYKDIFIKITTVNRVYLQLVNVVLAGKASEIDALSKELDILVTNNVQLATDTIENNILKSQQWYVWFLLGAGFIALISALLIARNIAKPVKDMASTLSKLADGEYETVIPGKDRRDEVGKMAHAADDFKLMAINLDKQGAELSYANIELEEFAYRTSHDLRSPLVSSIALLDITKMHIKSGDFDEAEIGLNHATKSLKTLEILVKDILALTQTKNSEEDIIVIDTEKAVDQAFEKFTNMPNFERLNIQKTLKFKGELKTQRSRFVLVLENLISNAIKYQDISKENSYLEIKTYNLNDQFVLECRDNGLGIPQKQHQNLFKMFKRFHPKVSFGSGLGLYMMKKSMDVMGGQIEFEDIQQGGSVFRLIIPT